MAFIANEVPSGTIDGVNTTFTTSKPISIVDEVVVDGAEYFDFSFTRGSTTLTLTDAPTASIRVDYYDTASFVSATGISQDDLRTDFNRLLKDTSDVSSELFNLWLNFISNYIYRVITDQEPERFIVEQSYSITNANLTYALPSDFWSINRNRCGLYKLDANNKLDKKLVTTQYKDEREGFYININNIYITPDPTNVDNFADYTAILRYIPRISQITDPSDEVPLPDEFKEVIEHALKKFYFEWDRNSGEEQLSDQRYVRMLEDLMSEYCRTACDFEFIDTSLTF